MKPTSTGEAHWQLSQASVRGKAHVDNQLPNQDSVSVVTSPAGDAICAVVSDGAGTAARSGEGSRLTAKAVAELMCDFGSTLRDTQVTTELVRQEFERSIERVRKSLEASGGSLREFHCTVVAWLYMPGGAFIAQLGDSVALTTRFASVDDAGDKAVDLFPDTATTLHEVERGEYANETHFITEADWREHLRVSKLPHDVDAVVLMTDGAMDIAMLRGKVYRGFLANLLAKLMGTEGRDERGDIIHAWLDDRQTYGVTGDDKTIFAAVRQARRTMARAPIYLGRTEPPPAAPPAVSVAVATSHLATPLRAPEAPGGAPPPGIRLLPALPVVPKTPHRAPVDSYEVPEPPPLSARNQAWIIRVQAVVIVVLLAALGWLGYRHFAKPSGPAPSARSASGGVEPAKDPQAGPWINSGNVAPADPPPTNTAPTQPPPADFVGPPEPPAAPPSAGAPPSPLPNFGSAVQISPAAPKLSATSPKVKVKAATGQRLVIDEITTTPPQWTLDAMSTCQRGVLITDEGSGCELVLKKDQAGSAKSAVKVRLVLRDVNEGKPGEVLITFAKP